MLRLLVVPDPKWISIVLIIQISANVLMSLVEGNSVKCYHGATRPDEKVLQQNYSDWLLSDGDFHDSLFQLIPQNAHKSETKSEGLFHRNHKRIGHLFGDRTCLATLPNNTNTLMDKSTCPYSIDIWYSESRYPQYMATARCKCASCYDDNGAQPARNGVKRWSPSRCKEITYNFKVLKQEIKENGRHLCDDGTVYRYSRAYETIAVGCACAVSNDRHKSQQTFRLPENI